jgi:hypothetical protein
MSDEARKTATTHEEKIQWMAVWAARNGVALELAGECGFGRECVGITADGRYPSYDDDGAGDDIWTPERAYHKSPCVAVLGRGEEAEAQLYDWLRWFDANGYTVERGDAPDDEWKHLGVIGVILGKHKSVRMVKRDPAKAAGR